MFCVILCFLLYPTLCSGTTTSNLTGVCTEIAGGYNQLCKKEITYPTVEVTYKEVCISSPGKKTVKYTCVKHWKKATCTKTVDIEFKKCSKVPDGGKVTEKKVSICDVSGNINKTNINEKSSVCTCLDSLQKAVVDGAEIFKADSVTSGLSDGLDSVVSAMGCVGQFFTLMNDEADVNKELEDYRSKTEDVIVKLPALDLGRLKELVSGVFGCAASLGTDCDKISDFFTTYLSDSKNAMMAGLKEYGNKVVDQLNTPITEGRALIEDLKGNYTQAKSLSQTVLSKCTTAGSKVSSSFQEKFSKMESITESLEQLENLGSLKDNLTNAYEGVDEAISNSDTAEYVKNFFKSGDIKTIKEALAALPDMVSSASSALEDTKASINSMAEGLTTAKSALSQMTQTELTDLLDQLQENEKIPECTSDSNSDLNLFKNSVMAAYSNAEQLYTDTDLPYYIDSFRNVSGSPVTANTSNIHYWYHIDAPWPCIEKASYHSSVVNMDLKYYSVESCTLKKDLNLPHGYLPYLVLNYIFK